MTNLKLLSARLRRRVAGIQYLLPRTGPRNLYRLLSWFWKLRRQPRQDDVSAEQLAGWTPLIVDFKAGRVVWVDLEGAALEDRLFNQTVLRFIQEHKKTGALVTGLSALEDFGAASDGLRPAAFIFHVSRCGSTLLSSALSLPARNLVISEAAPINFILTATRNGLSDASKIALLKGVLAALSRAHGKGRERLIVKFSSLNVMQLPLIDAAFPAVPRIFLYRDPVEVIVSNRLRGAGWLRARRRSKHAQQILHLDVDAARLRAMSLEEYCARVVGNFCRAGVRYANENTLLINYRELSLPTLLRVLSFLEIEPSDDEVEKMAEILRFDVKAPRRDKPFRDDSLEKQRLASDQLRAFVGLWASESYAELERLRLAALS